ncbi:fatty acid CoA ligase FadD9 [Rhodococcus sp. AG1013]|uniref:AMP-binding protein n=1 Tax=Rhodococcus sp. AG1013 TaxID=2183996 RepID=UPI000E09EB90|nr:AMP-binding protein [Rhodococcus sp. AG1013]RDI18034.1 fatty acid CoA ligase FadD9 [Rhodococcus sp. AG1013]
MTAETPVDERLVHRVEDLSTTDPQFRAAAPDLAVTAAARRGGLRLSEVVAAYLDGYADRPALGRRAHTLTTDPDSGRTTVALLPRFETITYRALRERAAALARSWQAELPGGVRAGDFVAVLGFTSIDYAVIDLTCIRLGAVSVPLQSSSTARQLAPIVAETAPRVLAEELDRGAALPAVPAFVPAQDDDPLAMLIYTSGSTGAPKGAMYTTDMVTRMWQRSRGPDADVDGRVPAIHVQYMPLSHVFGLGWLVTTLSSGGTGYFAARNAMSSLFDDIALARPTALNLVPRVCEMIFQRYRRELDRRPPGASPDAVKSDLRRNVLGGRVLTALCGSAPLSEAMHSFVESTLDVTVNDGYGSTETGGGVLRNGRILRPPVTDYKLVDVPELGYLTGDEPYPRGELCVKSTNLIPGYYKHPELSASIFDRDGFYKTGDIMAETAPDRLVYLDRRNNVIKLSQGEFVAISKLESVYSTSPYLRQIFIYGSSEQSFLLAVIVPNPDTVGDGDAHTLIAASLQQIADDIDLDSYEIPRDFLLESEPFTRDNGLLSGIGKLLRPALADLYGPRLEAMYDEIAAGQDTRLAELRAAAADLPTLEAVRRAAAVTLGVPDADIPDGDDAGFADLGGDSLAAFTFATTLEQLFDVDVPVQTIVSPIATLGTITKYLDGERSSAATRPTFASVHGRGATIARAEGLRLDAFIDAATLAAAPSLPAPTGTVDTVLMTGANGYLGRFLCLAWLERLARTGGTLICITRGADPAEARQRIVAAIDSGDEDLSVRFRALADDHLEVLAGDVGDPYLGLDQPTWSRLADSVDLIVHSAALVNHVLPYSQLFGPNVVGTAEIVRLAITARLKPVDYISTVAVTALPGGGFIGEDVDVRAASPSRALDASYANGYATSKWAGEVLLREAHDLCGLPVTVFRSDMILAHSRYAGQLNVPDMFTRLMLSLVATGIAPRSFYRLDAAGHRQRAHYDDWLARFEAAIESLPDNQRQHSVRPLLSAYAHPAPARPEAQPPSEQFRAAVQSAGIDGFADVPHLTESLIDKYIADLRRLGLLAASPSDG